MAAEASRDDLANSRMNAKTQDAGKITLPLWRPRDGKTLQLERLLDDLQDRLGTAKISEGTLNDPMPTFTQIANRYPGRSEEDLRALHERACREFQDENRFIWDSLRPSLLIDGVYERSDRQAIRELTTGIEKDGRGLLRWALTWSDDRNIEKQRQLRADLDKIKFPSDCTRIVLRLKGLELFEIWCRIAGNDPMILCHDDGS